MPKLRAVTLNERAHKKMTVIDAAHNGTHPDLLRALRDRVRDSRPQRTPRDLAALSRQLLEISKELQALNTASTEEDPIGQAAATADESWQPV